MRHNESRFFHPILSVLKVNNDVKHSSRFLADSELVDYLFSFPENARHPFKQRFSRAMVRVMHDIAQIGSSLGLGSEVNITRRVSELNTLFSREPEDGSLWVKFPLLLCISHNAYKELLLKSKLC